MYETVWKEYRKIDGQDYKIHISYTKGGMSFSTYKMVPRGFILNVTPVEIQEGTFSDGQKYKMETSVGFSGYSHHLLECNRRTAKQERLAIEESKKWIDQILATLESKRKAVEAQPA